MSDAKKNTQTNPGQGTQSVWSADAEISANPTFKILDLSMLAKAAKKAGAIVIVDNTFASPINQNPLKLDADLVVHSATKFLGGHSDALGGIVFKSMHIWLPVWDQQVH